MARGFDSQSDAAGTDLHDGDPNLIPDTDGFVLFSRKDQHGYPPC